MVDIGLRLEVLLAEEMDMRLEMVVVDERPLEEEGEAERGVEMSELDELYGYGAEAIGEARRWGRKARNKRVEEARSETAFMRGREREPEAVGVDEGGGEL